MGWTEAAIAALVGQVKAHEATIERLEREHADCPKEGVGCPSCDPVGARGRGCGLCNPQRFVNTETPTRNTSSRQDGTPAGADAAAMQLQMVNGIPPEYRSLLAELVDALRGVDGEYAPHVLIAARSLEYELAERLLDALS